MFLDLRMKWYQSTSNQKVGQGRRIDRVHSRQIPSETANRHNAARANFVNRWEMQLNKQDVNLFYC